jgi:hypothetical protein
VSHRDGGEADAEQDEASEQRGDQRRHGAVGKTGIDKGLRADHDEVAS